MDGISIRTAALFLLMASSALGAGATRIDSPVFSGTATGSVKVSGTQNFNPGSLLVNGTYPVTNIIPGSNVTVTGSNGSFTISSTGGGGGGGYQLISNVPGVTVSVSGTVITLSGTATNSLYLTSASGAPAHLSLTVSGQTITLGGSVTASDVGLPNVTNNGFIGTYTIGNGSFTTNNAGQITSATVPTNLVFGVAAGSGITTSTSGGIVTVNATSGGGGTVTSITAGNGLAGGTITGSGTLSMSGTFNGNTTTTGTLTIGTTAISGSNNNIWVNGVEVITAASGSPAHLTLSVSGNIVTLGGSVTASDVGLPNVSNTGYIGTINFGNGSLTMNSAGQVTSATQPSNLFTNTSTLNNTQLPTFTLNAPSGLFQTPVTFTSGTGTLLLSNTNTTNSFVIWTGSNTLGPGVLVGGTGVGVSISGSNFTINYTGTVWVNPGFSAVSSGTTETITCSATHLEEWQSIPLVSPTTAILLSGTYNGANGFLELDATAATHVILPTGALLYGGTAASGLTVSGDTFITFVVKGGTSSDWLGGTQSAQ